MRYFNKEPRPIPLAVGTILERCKWIGRTDYGKHLIITNRIKESHTLCWYSFLNDRCSTFHISAHKDLLDSYRVVGPEELSPETRALFTQYKLEHGI